MIHLVSVASPLSDVYIISSMNYLPAKLLAGLKVLPVAIFFFASLFSCGDAGCCLGTGDDQCASLICTLFANHDVPSGGDSGSPAACSCVCQPPTITRKLSDDFGYFPPVLRAGFAFLVSSSSAPSRPIDHPPLAA